MSCICSEVLFKHKSIEVVRRDMGTLEDETQLSSVIIDAWTAVLNNKEQYKSAQSPARLFVNINKSVIFLLIHLSITLHSFAIITMGLFFY